MADLECVRGDRRLFAGLSFCVEPGSLLHVHGPNGSGKTTLLRAVSGLVLQEAGRILWRGEEIRRAGEDYYRELLYHGHAVGLKLELSGYQNLRIFGRLGGFGVTEAKVESAMKRLGLARCVDLPVKVLSQGQKKRVSLARLLLQPASLWVLDEPFTALDVAAVGLLQTLIQDYVAGGGMVIMTTHQEVDIPAQRIQHIHLDS